MTGAAQWSARRRHAAVVFNNQAWVLGGDDGSFRNDVWFTQGIVTNITTTTPTYISLSPNTNFTFYFFQKQ